MSRATPRPWKVDQRYKADVLDSNGKDIFKVFLPNYREEQSENFANAELIVRAVNCHEELVDKLELIVDFVPNVDERERIKNLLNRARGE